MKFNKISSELYYQNIIPLPELISNFVGLISIRKRFIVPPQ